MGVVEGMIRRRWDREAPRLDVCVGVAGINKTLASRAAKPVGESPVVGALRPGGVITGAPSWREPHAGAHSEDHAEPPAIPGPTRRASQGVWRRTPPAVIQ